MQTILRCPFSDLKCLMRAYFIMMLVIILGWGISIESGQGRQIFTICKAVMGPVRHIGTRRGKRRIELDRCEGVASIYSGLVCCGQIIDFL